MALEWEMEGKESLIRNSSLYPWEELNMERSLKAFKLMKT
jgi:hypothetical protein